MPGATSPVAISTASTPPETLKSVMFPSTLAQNATRPTSSMSVSLKIVTIVPPEGEASPSKASRASW